MISKSISCCYFPTTSVFIDDNHKFLERLKLEIDVKKTYPMTFYNPQDALDFLNNTYQKMPFIKSCVSSLENESWNQRNIFVNIKNIHKAIFDKNRFNEISVVIVDYAMPGLDGLALCDRLNKSSVKKILLTGEASEKVAIKAFNERLIDRYIKKDDPQFSITLNHYITELQYEYFVEQSLPILTSLTEDTEQSGAFLTDTTFIELFQSILSSHQIIEYYLMDNSGSFMFVDFEGNLSWLAVKNEHELLGFYEFAKNSNASDEILKKLRDKSFIPYFQSDDDFKSYPSQWDKFMNPASRLQGQQTYYYSYIKNNPIYSIGDTKEYSLREYLNSYRG